MILIVDDRAENILPLKRILEMNGYSTDSASSGEIALKKILKNTYSLIILDVQMPIMDGFEVAETISNYSKAKDTPIIFLSAANKEKEFVTKGYGAGGMDYITKPVDPDILLLKVKTFVKLFEHQQKLKTVQESLVKEIDTRRQAEENLRMVLESMPQLSFTITPDGEIEYVNKQWLEYSHSSTAFPEIHPQDQAVLREWQKMFEAGKEFASEVRLKKLETKEYAYFLLKIVPIVQYGIILRWVGTFSDIHQQKLSNEQLESVVRQRTEELLAKNSQLEQINQELQQFSWVVSHDLKEPLRKIQTFNTILKEKYVKDNPEAIAYLDRSILSASRLTELIKDLLDFSHLSAAGHFIPVDLHVLINELLTDFEDAISEKKAKIVVTKLPVIDAIPDQLKLVFQNLLTNSLKFQKKENPPMIEITSEIVDARKFDANPSPEGKFCKIIFKDNGIGFNENYLEKIFIVFQQLNPRDQYEGTGIGLSIAKKIVEKHKGLITAQSGENQGASFIMIFPLKQKHLNDPINN